MTTHIHTVCEMRATMNNVIMNNVMLFYLVGVVRLPLCGKNTAPLSHLNKKASERHVSAVYLQLEAR